MTKKIDFLIFKFQILRGKYFKATSNIELFNR